MATKSLNKSLHKARQDQNDEFYTQLADIENELKHYKDQFRGKVIFCNCDDPYESNFFKFFANNFNAWKLKKIIATSYAKSPIVGGGLPLFEIEGLKPKGKEPFKIEINKVPDANGDGAVDLTDVRHLLMHDANTATPLKGSGDFRSEECVKLLKQADIVVTNPPFSLFREYVAELAEYDKKFLILGNQNAITYKEIFKLIKENKLWLGYDNGGTKWFQVPDSYDIQTESRKKIVDGVKYFSMGSIMWFTNLYVDKSGSPLTPYLTYEKGRAMGLYPKYDNYDAIEVSKVSEIPRDYYGVMGVPITFLQKWTPDSNMEIVKFRKGDDGKDLTYTKQRGIISAEREREREREYNLTSEFSFAIVGSNRGVGQDETGYYGRGTFLNGKETFKRLFVQRI